MPLYCLLSTPELAFHGSFYDPSFHKPLLKNYYVKFIGRIFMKGRVLLLKGFQFHNVIPSSDSLFLGGCCLLIMNRTH